MKFPSVQPLLQRFFQRKKTAPTRHSPRLVERRKARTNFLSRVRKIHPNRRAVAAIALLVILAVGPGAYFYLQNPNRVQGAWFDTNWGFRQKVPITNTSGSTQTDFQVQVTIDTATLITAGKLQSSCQDMRFTSQTGKVLPYWIEPNTCNTTTTLAWIKVDSIPTATSGTAADIYFYYGNASASSTSDPGKTFIKDFGTTTSPGAVAAWPLDDTTTTQSFSRVVNATTSAGRNLTINGTFDADASWTKQAGWTIANGVAHGDGTGSGTYLYQALPIVTGKMYSITFTISSYVSGSVRALYQGSNTGTSRTANGTYTEIIKGDGTSFSLQSTLFSGDIDNVIVTQLNIPDSGAGTTNMLTDGNMETAGVAAWTAGNNATLTKQTTSPHGGTQVLRVAKNGTTNPYVGQLILTSGVAYRLHGYMRSDGSAIPQISNTSGASLQTGTTSTAWQAFDVTFVANGIRPVLMATTTVDGQYVEFDDVVVSIDQTVRQGEVIQDGNMEASGTGVWSSALATLTKDTSSPHGGTQNLRVTRNGVNNGFTSQIILVTGKKYRATGWMKSDGNAQPKMLIGGGNTAGTTVTGTTSTSWQFFDLTAVADGTSFILQSLTSTGTQYTEWDDISVTEVSPLVGLPASGVVLGSFSGTGGHLATGYTFDGTNDAVDIYSSDLNSIFNQNEGTMMVWVKVSSSGVWTDANTRRIFYLQADANNRVFIDKTSVNNRLSFNYLSGGTSKIVTADSISSTGWIQLVLTWSKSSDQVKAYINGAQTGSTLTSLGTWSGNIASANAVIGASNNTGSNAWSGMINDARLYTRALTSDEIAMMYSSSTDIQAYTTPNYPGHELFRKYNTLVGVSAAGSEETGAAPGGYWNFDEGTGTTAKDTSSTKNAGTLTNMASPPSATSGWVTEDQCISGKCLKFDGSNDYVTAANNSSLNPTNALTLDAWVKRSATGTRQLILGKGDGLTDAQTQYWMEINASNQLVFQLGHGSSHQTLTATDKTITDTSTWHHIVMTYDKVTMKVYLDGYQSSVTVADTANINTSTNNFSVGRMGTLNSLYFNGFIDEPKVYRYARSAAQIKADYIQGAARAGSSSVQGFQQQGPLSNGLVGYWKMDETSAGASRIDSSGNSYTLTDHNTVAASAGKFGNAGGFTAASSQYVDITDTNGPNLSINSADIQVSAWVKLTSTATQTIVSKYSSSGAGEYRLIYNGGFQFRVNGDQGLVTASNFGTASTGTWYFVTAWYKRSDQTLNIQVNDTAPNSSVYSAVVPGRNTSANFMIGAFATNSPQQFANATIDEVRVYKRLLSAAEIRQLYQWAPGPVGYWNFDEKTGTSANDTSGNGNTATLTNGPTWTTGKYGASIKFDGTDDYVNVPTSSSLNFGSNDFTVSAWIKNSTSGGNQYIIAKRTGCTNNQFWSLGINSANKVFVEIDESNAGNYTHLVGNATNLRDGSWHYVTATKTTSTLSIYVDGKLDTSSAISVNPNVGNAFAITIGQSAIASGCAGNFNGTIDQIQLYNYVRTSGQIIEDMRGTANAGSNGIVSAVGGTSSTQPASPLGYWKFDEGQGTTTSNLGSAGTIINGTLTNMANPATSTSGWNNSGKVNKAVNLDGSNDFISIPSDATVQPTSAFSGSIWVKRAGALGSTQYFFGKGDGLSNPTISYYTGLNTSNQLFFTLSTSAGARTLTATDSTITDTNWHLVTTTWDGSTMRIYLDGNLSSVTSSLGGTMVQTSQVLAFGRLGTFSLNYFNGSFDEAKIFSFALTPDQVKTEYNQSSSVNYGVGATLESSTLTDGTGNAPVAEWKFDEKTGTSAFDTSGNANTGTLTNGPVWASGKYGAGIKLDGVNDYLSTSVSLGTTFTVSAWINYLGTSAIQVPIGGNNSLDYFFANISGNLTSSLRNGSATQITCAVTSGVRTGWHFYSSTVSTSGSNVTWTIYRDGIQVQQCTSSGGLTAPTLTQIGRGGTSPYYFNGSMDHVQLYNYARTQAQVAYDYNRGGPVGWWKMDECQGTSIGDWSGNLYNGTLTVGSSGTQTQAGTCNTSGTAWANGITGKFNNSLNFDGNDDYVEIADNDAFSVKTTNQLTVSGWINASSLSGEKVIITKGASNNYEWDIRFQSTGRIDAYILQNSGGSSMAATSATGAATTGRWYFVAFTFDSTTPTLKLYVNGQLVTTTTSMTGSYASVVNGTAPVRFGKRADNNSPFTGQVDDVRIFNYALSATQIQKLYNNNASVFYGPSTGAP